ncbi:MAG: type III secretion system export apparatus subunit SctT [Thiotrichaceae bacterium]|nr:type III secretion system export apparatus subunit SctT [Thiotrichaceae bacterium]
MISAGQEQLWFLTLVLTIPRILGAFIAMPFLGQTVIPGLARNAVVMLIAAYAAPINFDQIATAPNSMTSIGMIIIKEFAIGFMLGFLVSIPFWSLSSAGFLIDTQRGSMSGQMFSNILADQTSALGDFFAKLAVTLLFTTGGFLLIIKLILLSYISWPIVSFYPQLEIADAGIFLEQFSLIFYTAALIAGPIVATMFIVEIGAALIARYVPQLNIFLLMMPIKSGIALLLIIFYMTYLSRYMRESFLKFADIFHLLDDIFK